MAPIVAPDEMDLPIDDAVARLRADEDYRRAFADAFGEEPTTATLVRAIATFVRTLVSRDSRWDRWRRGDANALTAAEQRGQAIFFGDRGECFHCHDGPDLTTGLYANSGTYVEGGDVGRQRVTLAPRDAGKFKIPTLRNVAVTAPYMHDGSVATLDDVVEHYARGGRGSPNTDPNVHPLPLTADERADLVAFLRALTDDAFLADVRLRP